MDKRYSSGKMLYFRTQADEALEYLQKIYIYKI